MIKDTIYENDQNLAPKMTKTWLPFQNDQKLASFFH